MNRGFRPGFFTLYSPPIWRATSSESFTTSISRAPSSRASSSASSTARYSATLLVASPMYAVRSPNALPSGSVATAATAAGPGFPRAPPSTWTTIFRDPSVTRHYGRERAGHAVVPAVARFALLLELAGILAGAAVGALAAVDDDFHVGVVLVVLDHAVVELVRESLGHDAVDHCSERTPMLIRPSAATLAFQSRAASSSWSSSSPLSLSVTGSSASPRSMR